MHAHSTHCVVITTITNEYCIHREKMVSSKSCLTDSSLIYLVSWFHRTWQHVTWHLIFFSFLPDTGGTKGEKLSAKLKPLPGTNEPYESSSSKEIGKWAAYTFWLFWPSKRGELEKLSYWKGKYNSTLRKAFSPRFSCIL